MNSIPIVTVDDLASNAFQKSSGKIDLKLSKKAGNGLTLSDDGLAYSASGGTSQFQRLLLGRLGDMRNIRNVVVEDIEVYLNLQDLGSDGKYLYVGATAPVEMRVSIFEHADSDNYGVDGGVNYTQSFNNNYWGSDTKRLHISYNLNGVNKAILLSRASFNGVYYIWADVLSIPSSDSGEGGGSGNIIIDGATFKSIYLIETFNEKYALIEGETMEGDYDLLLLRILPEGGLDTEIAAAYYAEADNPGWIRYYYHQGSDLLIFQLNNGALLEVYQNDISMLVETSRTALRKSIHVYVDSTNGDLCIAVAYGEHNLVDIYKVADSKVTLLRTVSVGFSDLPEGNALSEIYAISVVNDNQLAVVMDIEAQPQYISEVRLFNLANGSLVANRVISISSQNMLIPDSNLFIETSMAEGNLTVKLCGMDETGINTLKEQVFPGIDGQVIGRKLAFDPESEGPQAFPGVYIGDWYGGNVLLVATPYWDAVASAWELDVLEFTMSEPLTDVSNLGVGETIISAIDSPYIYRLDNENALVKYSLETNSEVA